MWNIPEPSSATSPHPASFRRSAGATHLPESRPGCIRRSMPLHATALAVAGFLHALPAQGVEFGEGEFQGSLDTTISHGLTFRVGKHDDAIAAKANSNDGELNYGRGLVSNTSKFTTDLDVGSGDFGAFVRATGFIDFENQNGRRERTPLSDEAKDQVGRDLEVLDAYVTGTFDVGTAIADVRLGKHVLNWGESTYIPNGINAINPFDVGKLRLPGSELREALLPVWMASASLAPSDNLSVEGFYQFKWEKTEIDPVGSYYSVTDYVGPGARKAVVTAVTENDEGHGFDPPTTPIKLTTAINADLAAYAVPNPPDGDPISLPQPLQPKFDPDFASVLRGPDREPGDSGQWGLALRYLAPELNDTEFGFYFVNYHSRLPLVGANQGTNEGLAAGLDAAAAVGNPDSATAAAIAAPFAKAVAQVVAPQAQAAALESGLTDPAQIQDFVAEQVADQVTEQFGEQIREQVGGIAGALAIDRFAKTTSYHQEYPEDIPLLGVSFNTQLGASGWALQGEYSLRPDAPLQRAERTLFGEGLAPIVRGLELARTAGAARERAVALQSDAVVLQTAGDLEGAARVGQAAMQAVAAALKAKEALDDHRDNYQPKPIPAYIERDVSQLQATATRVFGPMLGADRLVFLTEVALQRVHGMPDRLDEPIESPAVGETDADADATATSWGYRVATRLDYNNAIGAVNLFPYAQFRDDVNGNSPTPAGPFAEGTRTLTLGLGAGYLSRWQADIGYTMHSGRSNDLRSRDFISASIKYSF